MQKSTAFRSLEKGAEAIFFVSLKAKPPTRLGGFNHELHTKAKMMNIFDEFEEKHSDFFKNNGGLKYWVDFVASDTQNPISLSLVIRDGLPAEIHEGLLKLYSPGGK